MRTSFVPMAVIFHGMFAANDFFKQLTLTDFILCEKWNLIYCESELVRVTIAV